MDGWHARENDNTNWWRWTAGIASFQIKINQAAVLEFSGALLQIFIPQKIDIFVNGVLSKTWNAKEVMDLSIPLEAGESVVLLKGRKLGVPAGPDPRALAFGVKNLVLRPRLKNAAACELN